MAYITVKTTINGSAGHAADAQTAAITAISDEAAITADIAAVNADVTAAIANVTIAGDPTALGLVTQIQTDMTTLAADYATLVADLALASGTSGADVILSYKPSTVVSKNALKQAMAAIMICIAGAKDLT